MAHASSFFEFRLWESRLWVHANLLRLCPTLCEPMDCNYQGSSVLEILQAGILEWVAMPLSRWSSWLRDWTCIPYISCITQAGSLPLVPPGQPHRAGWWLFVSGSSQQRGSGGQLLCLMTTEVTLTLIRWNIYLPRQNYWASLVVQRVKNLQCMRPRFEPWVGKIPWKRQWLPTPVFFPGEFHWQRL